jgi:hypothetical protein
LVWILWNQIGIFYFPKCFHDIQYFKSNACVNDLIPLNSIVFLHIWLGDRQCIFLVEHSSILVLHSLHCPVLLVMVIFRKRSCCTPTNSSYLFR